jgi:hypothetical protein
MQRFGKRRFGPFIQFLSSMARMPAMSRFALICIGVLFALPAMAETLEQAERRCAGEFLQGARAACLGYLSERKEMAMEARIASTLAGLQAASAAELRALASRYRDAQAAWRAAIAEDCGDEDALFRERCRLAAVLAREEEVSDSLVRAADDLGGPEEPLLPEGVEVYVPLELPRGVGRRDVEVGVPLWVPILP